MYFPPAFFDVMVHLLVHIVDDIVHLGPPFLHNMMAFEKMNGVIKGFLLSHLQKEEKVAAQCSSSQGSSSKAPWDNPFHRAVNKVMERPVSQPPHRGRIVGEGLGRRPSLHFPESKEDRAKRKQQEDTDVKT
jgi:hypothetical protein